MKKAIVICAGSGIGEELAKVLWNEGYIVGLVARRGISSIGALLANPAAPAYNASKMK